MKRRDFLKKTGLVAAGAFAAPYILPTGRLFASTGGIPMANHVVLVMFAGGVRHQEAIGQGYLEGSQYMYASDYHPTNPGPIAQELHVSGNIMNNMLEGSAPTQKIIYGSSASSYLTPLAPILSQTIQKQGMLFKEMKSSNAGHYGGLNVMLQGGNAIAQGLKNRPLNPTMFEYLRRHGGSVDFPASKVWMIGNTIGNSIPLLNHSLHPDYGPKYGANFFAPSTTFGAKGDLYLKNAKLYHPQDQLDPMYEMKYFLDNSFENIGTALPNIGNTEDEKQQIKQFMRNIFARQDGSIGPPLAYPPNLSPGDRNGDINTISYACEVLKEFKPKLLVVNLSGVDTAHGNFTAYLRSLHRADYAVGHLWNFIQNDPSLSGTMANNTIMIAAPECGRNAAPNAIKDPSKLLGYDHSDANTSRVFTLMVGGSNTTGVTANQVYTDAGTTQGTELPTITKPETADIAITIAQIFGLKTDVLNSGLTAYDKSLFDRI